MNKVLQQKLFNDFPELYEDRKLTPQQSCLYFGIETDNGWFDLIYELSAELMKISKNIRADQVKEKFGGLRFYWHGLNITEEEYKNVETLVDIAENTSYDVCEECGNREDVKQTSGWITTLCEICMEKREVDNMSLTMSKSMGKRLKVQKNK